MNKVQYLNQARELNKKINIKIERYYELKALAEKATKVLTGMPRGGVSKADDTIAKLVDMATEVNDEISKLVDKQLEISNVVKAVKGREGMVLELHYLCYNDWHTVADKMGYDVRQIYRLHNEALKKVKIPRCKDV